MLLQQNGSSTAKTSRFAVTSRFQSRWRSGQYSKLQLALNNGSKSRPYGRDFTRNQDEFGRKSGSDKPKAATNGMGLAGNRLNCNWVVLFGEPHEAVDIDRRTVRRELAIKLQCGARRSSHLPAAALSTTAYWTCRINRNMSELTGEPVVPGM